MRDTSSIAKAVIGCAGRGTRMLPATKAMPKAMLPVGNKPAIHHIIDSLVLNDITKIMIVIGHGSETIVDYFATDATLARTLREGGKSDIVDMIETWFDNIQISFCYQHEQLGTGHMFLTAQDWVGDDYWLAMYGDEIVHPLTIRGMCRAFAATGDSYVGVQDVPREKISKYGVLELDSSNNIVSIVEKPSPELAPSTLANRGPFIFAHTIFDVMHKTPVSEQHGEILLTDTIGLYARENTIRPYVIEHMQRDIGNVDARFQTNNDLAAYGFDIYRLGE